MLVLAPSFDFVLHAVLALSAEHKAWSKGDHSAKLISIHHQSLAYKGLQAAVNSFSEGNADAILATSMLLAWQADDW